MEAEATNTDIRFIICSIIKNEHSNLIEWIEHHLSIGFSDIFLYEDYGSESHASIADEYKSVHLSKYSEYIANSTPSEVGSKRQMKLYCKFLFDRMGDNSWCAFIDIDEYVMLSPRVNLKDIANRFRNNSGVAMYWRMMKSGGLIKKSPKGIVESYTQTGPLLRQDKNWAFKSFVNMSVGTTFDSTHYVRGCVNENGESVVSGVDNTPVYKDIWLNHYYTKSFEDWEERFRKRGDLSPNHRSFWGFFEINKEMAYYYNMLYSAYISNEGIDITEAKYQLLKKEYDMGFERNYGETQYIRLSEQLFVASIPKCGCTALKDTSPYKHCVGGDVHQSCITYSKSEIPSGSKVIAVYRSPEQRVASFLSDKVFGRGNKRHSFGCSNYMDVIRTAKNQYDSSLGDVSLVDMHLRRQRDFYSIEDVDAVVDLSVLEEYLRAEGIKLSEKKNASPSRYLPNESEVASALDFYSEDLIIKESPKYIK